MALFTMMAASILGGLILARMGRRLLASLVSSLARRTKTPVEVSPDGFLTFVGALLLILPGFLSDLAGLLLLVPLIQRRLATTVPSNWTRAPDDVIDLNPAEWRDIPSKRLPTKPSER